MGKTKKIIVGIIIFFAVLLFNQSAYAMSQADAGQALADFSIYFYQHYGARTLYSVAGRETTYTGVTVGGYYKFDCVGWVDFAVHQSLKLGGASMEYFAVPPGGGNHPWFRSGFECIKGDVYNANNLLTREEVETTVQPGDILFCGPEGPHVVIYVGDHNIIHCYSNLECEDLYENDMHYTGYCAIGRITSSTAAGLDKNNIVTMFTGEGYDEEGLPYNGSSGNFKYKGTTSGSYNGTYNTLSWLFDNILGFFDYLIGMLFYIIRAPFVGWANIIEYMINDTINDLSGVEMSSVTVQLPKDDDASNTEDTENTESTETSESSSEDDEEEPVKVRNGGYFIPSASNMYEVNGSNRINIEHIIYNEVPILDVDFFDVDLSDYADSEIIAVSEDSVIYKLRENVAIWYNIIRSFSIVSLVIVLIYLGIRLAISTTAGTKAKYKSMLTAWVTSFIIVFLIHYFMIAVIEVNDVLLGVFKGEELKYTGGLSMYDTIRTRAYSIKLSEGLPATVMYMVLIYFLIRFLFIYVKRYFTVNILALMGPIMGIKYAIDKINTGKSGSMGAWMYDFALNVLLQSVHALIYTIFMAIAFEVGMESIPGFILALFILNFIFNAEKIFLDVFKFNGRSSSLSDVNKHTNYFLEAYKVGRGLAFFPGAAFGFVKNTTKAVGGLVLDTVQAGVDVGAGIVWAGDAVISKLEKNEHDEYKSIDVREKMQNALDTIKSGAANVADDTLYKITGVRSLRLGLNRLKKTDKKAYETTKELLDKNKKLKQQVMKRYISGSVKSIKTMATLTASIPMMIVDPGSGFTMFTTTVGDIKDLATGKPHYGHRTKKEIRSRRGRIAAIALTGAGGYAAYSAIDNFKEFGKDKKKIAKNELMLADLREARMLEESIEEQVGLINKHLEEEKEKQTTEEQAKKVEETIDAIKAETISRTLDTALAGKDIKNIVKGYMERNNLETLSSSDIESIIRDFNIQNIQKEIKALTGGNESTIKRLEDRVKELEEQLRTGIDKANNDIDRNKVRKKLKSTKAEIKKVELDSETIQKVGEAIQRDGELGEGMFIEKHNVRKIINEYKEDTKKQKLEDSDISKIVDMFNSKVKGTENSTNATQDDSTKESQIPTYASKDDIKAQFDKKDKKSKGLDKKEAINAMLDANHDKFVQQSVEINAKPQENSEPKKYDEYSLLSDLLRDLETLNQKSINNFGRTVTDMKKVKETIKDNNFKK